MLTTTIDKSDDFDRNEGAIVNLLSRDQNVTWAHQGEH